MLIINADDWGRSQAETDVALTCCSQGTVTSVSGMVFMEDSERAATIAKERRVDVGLHLNLSERFTGTVRARQVADYHNRIVSYLKRHKYCQLLYNPTLRTAFRNVYQAQFDEFLRIYGKLPSHIDGHQHMHLCSNMLVDAIVPKGEKIRRSFSFWPGEKGRWNRAYRRLVDWRLAGRYHLTDYFFALSQNLDPERLKRVCRLAQQADVELMTHPAQPNEYATLASDNFHDLIGNLEINTYASL